MTRAVANRYIAALSDILLEPGSSLTPEAALEQLQSFGSMLRDAPDLELVLRSPAISPQQKRELIAGIGERAGWSPIIRNFLFVVIEHHRLTHFGVLLRCYQSWLDAFRGRVEVEIRVAREIDDGQRAAFEQRFRDLTGKHVRTSYVVDPSLLGGSVARVGSTLYDGSLRSALGSLAAGMATGGR